MTVAEVNDDMVECVWIGEEGDLFAETSTPPFSNSLKSICPMRKTKVEHDDSEDEDHEDEHDDEAHHKTKTAV